MILQNPSKMYLYCIFSIGLILLHDAQVIECKLRILSRPADSKYVQISSIDELCNIAALQKPIFALDILRIV